MNSYRDDLKVKEALQLYFSKYHFPNGGYDLKWFKIKIGPVYIPLPNTKGRIAAVKIHDIHHLLTEYEATLKGEAEIAGWEIASGCNKYYVAWLLNFASFFYGIFFFPVSLFHAFIKGRNSKTNFYHHTLYDEILLNKTVGELRRTTGVDEPYLITFKACLFFALYSAFLIVIAILFLLSLAAIYRFLF